MKQLHDRSEYHHALLSSGAGNASGLILSIDKLAKTAVDFYPGDLEYAQRTSRAVIAVDYYRNQNIWDGARMPQLRKEVKWLFDRTWERETLWQIGSDPAIALTLQALANSMSVEETRHGVVDSSMYDERTYQAKVMAYGQHLTVVDDGHGWTRLSLEVGTNWLHLSKYGMRRMIETLVPGRWAKSAEMIEVEEHVAVITGTIFSPYETVAEQVRRHNELGFDVVFNPPVAIGGGL